MAGIVTKIHVQTAFDWGPIDRYAPPTLQIRDQADNGGGKPTVPHALAMRDPDGETHVYILNDQARKQLIGKLTGGIMLPP